MNKNIKMLVIACNTATAFTLKALQEKLTIPVIGVIQPGARAAIKSTKNNRVGVIGTEGTVRSQAYTQALHSINENIHVNALACPLFVPMVEQGILSGPQAKEIVEESLQLFKLNNHQDTLILGCTHYPLIKDTIQEVIGMEVTVISSSEETARETSTTLDVHGLLFHGERIANHEFYTTGELDIFIKISKSIFQHSNLQTVSIEQAILN